MIQIHVLFARSRVKVLFILPYLLGPTTDVRIVLRAPCTCEFNDTLFFMCWSKYGFLISGIVPYEHEVHCSIWANISWYFRQYSSSRYQRFTRRELFAHLLVTDAISSQVGGLVTSSSWGSFSQITRPPPTTDPSLIRNPCHHWLYLCYPFARENRRLGIVRPKSGRCRVRRMLPQRDSSSTPPLPPRRDAGSMAPNLPTLPRAHSVATLPSSPAPFPVRADCQMEPS